MLPRKQCPTSRTLRSNKKCKTPKPVPPVKKTTGKGQGGDTGTGGPGPGKGAGGTKGIEKPPLPPPPPPGPTPEQIAAWKRHMIQQIRNKRVQVRRCAEKSGRSVAGSIKIQLRIGSDGRVKSVKILRDGNATLKRCAKRILKTLKVKRHPGGKSTTQSVKIST